MTTPLQPSARPAHFRLLAVAVLLAGLTGVFLVALNTPFTADVNGQGKPADGAKSKDPQQEEIKEFIGRYFRTWSEQDIKGYDSCFLPDACIQFIDPEGKLTTQARAPFVESQRNYHKTAVHRATEAPESIDIRMEGKLARVVVYWKLVAGPRIEFGYDHFTLTKQEGKWRIVNLVFYGTK